MTDLTDKWKKGELPEGWYYVKGSRVEGIYAYTAEYLNNMYRPRNGERIIEQVPSYDEWKAAYEYEKYADNEIKNLKAQNAQLKELLRECRKSFNKLKGDTVWYPYEVDECIAKIDEALK